MVLEFLAEAIHQPCESAHVHSHRQIAALHIRFRNGRRLSRGRKFKLRHYRTLLDARGLNQPSAITNTLSGISFSISVSMLHWSNPAVPERSPTEFAIARNILKTIFQRIGDC